MKKSSTKILLAHSSNDLYGASKVLINIVELLINKGHEVHLFLPEKGPLDKNIFIKKCNVVYMELGVFRKKYFNSFGLLNRFFFITRSFFFINRYIKVNKIDLVYINTSTVLSPCLSAKFKKIPCFFHVHEIPISSKIYSKFLALIFNYFSSKIIAVSNSVREYWIENGSFPEKIITIYNGFKFNFKSEKKTNNENIYFINVSRIIPYKGHLFLIELFNALVKKRKNLYLNIIGDTLIEYEPYRKELKEKVKEYGLEKNISFIGFKEEEEVKEYFNKSNFFIHCPVSPDPLPTVIFESIENNVPVICTGNGGSTEILDSGKNGLIIDNTSIIKSVNMILEYINDESIQKRHIINSKIFIKKNFNLSLFNNNIYDLISQV